MEQNEHIADCQFASTGTPAGDPSQVRLSRRLADLDRMIESGMAKIGRLDRQDEADEAAGLRPDRELYQIYDRTTRAVRIAMALQQRLEQEGEKQQRRGDVAAKVDRLERRAKQKTEVRQTVEAAIAVYPTPHDKEPLYERLYERLDAPDWIEHVGDRPAGEIAVALCSDLGIELDESLWAEAASYMAQAPADGDEPGEPRPPMRPEVAPTAALLESAGLALTRTVIEKALDGDVPALRLCLERLAPPTRDRPIVLPIRAAPSVVETAGMMAEVVAAMASGTITPGQAASAAGVIDTHRRVLELTEIDARLTALEAKEPP